MEDKEIREVIDKAITKSSYRWRTPEGIAKESGISVSKVLETLEKEEGYVRSRKANAKGGDTLYDKGKIQEDKQYRSAFTLGYYEQDYRLGETMSMPEQIDIVSLILVAGAGGFVLSMVNLWEDSKKPKSERVPKDFLYWLFFIFWPLAGAGLAWLYALDGSSLRPLLAFSIGLSAPATIQAMINKTAISPGPPPGSEP